MDKNCAETELVSIITVCLNAKSTIRQAIESVLSQTYPNIEYIICDGGSTDGTLDIISEYSERINIFICEPDNGISDAFNKGICCSNGAYIQLLNADDYFPADKIEQSVNALNNYNSASYVFGDVHFKSNDGLTLMIFGDPLYSNKIKYGMPRLNHTTMLAKSSTYRKHGLYDTKWKIAMDYDWLLRLHVAGDFGIYYSTVFTYMRDGGASSNWRKTLNEQRKIAITHGGNVIFAWCFYLFLYLKILVRLLLQHIFPDRILLRFRPGKKLINNRKEYT